LQFPGETAVFYFTATANGNPVNPTNMNVTIYFPNNVNNLALTPTQISTGVYMVSWAIPANAVTGFYALVVSATYQYGTFGGLAVKGFEISQGMQNNQNQVMTSIGALSDQLSSVETYVLSGQSQIMSSIDTVESNMLANQNEVMAGIGGLSAQLASVETNILTSLNSSASAAASPIVVTSAFLGALFLPSAAGAASQAFGFALLALITIAVLLSTSLLLKRRSIM